MKGRYIYIFLLFSIFYSCGKRGEKRDGGQDVLVQEREKERPKEEPSKSEREMDVLKEVQDEKDAGDDDKKVPKCPFPSRVFAKITEGTGKEVTAPDLGSARFEGILGQGVTFLSGSDHDLTLKREAKIGVYTSKVFEAKRIVEWTKVQVSKAITPGINSIQLLVRTGNTKSPDMTWSRFHLVSNFIPSFLNTSQYLQYQVILRNPLPNEPAPILDNIEIEFSSPPQLMWLTKRHNPQRTNYIINSSDIKDPKVLWHLYLGGKPYPEKILIKDLNQDLKPEIIKIEGGKIKAYEIETGAEIWQTKYLNPTQFLFAAYLDPDSTLDIGIETRQKKQRSLIILNGQTGAITWEHQISSGMFTRSATLLGDLTGDKIPELIVFPQNTKGENFVYTFRFDRGFIDNFNPYPNGNLMWKTSAPQENSGGHHILIGNINGDIDLHPEVIIFGPNLFVALNHQNGDQEFNLPNLRDKAKIAILHDIDKDHKEELIVANDEEDPLFKVIDVDGYNPLKWEISGANFSQIQLHPTSIGDIDHDSLVEIVISVWNDTRQNREPNKWYTLIIDAENGNEEHTIEDIVHFGIIEEINTLIGTVAFDLQYPKFSQICGYGFQPEKVSELWCIPYAAPTLTLPLRSAKFSSLTSQKEMISEPARFYLNRDLDKNTLLDTVQLIDISEESPQLITGTNLDPSLDYTPLGEELGYFYIASEDGWIVVLDTDLKKEISRIRLGGYIGDIIVGDPTNTGCNRIFAKTSTNELLEILPYVISPDKIPYISSKRLPKSILAHLIDLEHDRTQEKIIFDLNITEKPRLKILESYSERWHYTFLEPLKELKAIGADLNGDGNQEVFVYAGSSETGTIYGFSGLKGSPLWPPVRDIFSIKFPSVLDVNSDGKDDIILVGAGNGKNNFIVSGDSGEVLKYLGSSELDFSKGINVVANFDSDPEAEVLITNGKVVMVYDLEDEAILWKREWNKEISTDPSFIDVEGRGFFDIIVGTKAGKIGLWDLRNDRLIWERVLVRGESFDLGSEPEEILPQSILDIVSVTDLAGNGEPGILVGSGDGFLYFLNAQDGSLNWSYELEGAVGEIVLSDIDGDEKVEILVLVSDGFLYAIE
jgi:outer membrane protein assembly factor BamB